MPRRDKKGRFLKRHHRRNPVAGIAAAKGATVAARAAATQASKAAVLLRRVAVLAR